MDSAPEPSDDDRITVAIVGLGIGRLHLISFAELSQQFRVVAVCDLDEGRAREVAGWLRGVDALTSLDEVLTRDDVAVVALCTPPAGHRSEVERCLRAGKDVICEKPLVGSVREVDEIAALVAETGHTVLPVHQYRFGRGLQGLRALVDAGRTGRPYVANVEVAWKRDDEYYAAPWRGRWATELGGTLVSHAVHALDMVLYVLGPPASVWATTSTLTRTMEVEDAAAVVLRWADGSLATLTATTGSAAEVSRHRFTFEHLSAESGTAPYTNGAEPWTWTAMDPADQEDLEAFLAARPVAPEDHVGLFARYAAARAGGGPLPVTLDDARLATEVVTAMYVSSRTGRPVELPLAADDPAVDGWAP